MRVAHGRGNWRPSARIEGLFRIAFLGDSTMYGAGVAPDQTLPAASERHLNEAAPGCPVEAVNLGISGYNTLNSWLSFRHGPQVYDGIVLMLCSNDADILSRTDVMSFDDAQEDRWEPGHPFGDAVARCFDDIAAFTRERSLPILIVYSNFYAYAKQLRVGEIIGDLCAARDLFYVDTFPIFQDRNLALIDLAVSAADFHPSPLAHDVVARHLAGTIERRGWFDRSPFPSIDEAPERIVQAAEAMFEVDRYPPDAAVNWALGALAVKERVARRMRAMGAADTFSAPGGRALEALSSARRRYHLVQRARAMNLSICHGGLGVFSALAGSEEEVVRLDEMCFALGSGDWDRLAERAYERLPDQPAKGPAIGETRAHLSACAEQLSEIRQELAKAGTLLEPARIKSLNDESVFAADIDNLIKAVERLEKDCASAREAFERMDAVYNSVTPALGSERVEKLTNLLHGLSNRLHQNFASLPSLLKAVRNLPEKDPAVFTTIEATVSSELVEGKPTCLMTVHADYTAPMRFAFSDTGAFLPDGHEHVVRLRLPLFYIGRLTFRTFLSRGKRPPVEASLTKVEVYNRSNQRVPVNISSFWKDHIGRMVSPLVFLP